MNSPIGFKSSIATLIFLGFNLSCALGASGAPQVANFSDQSKDRHVGKMLIPASPSKPIEPSSTSVIKTSSTQGKAQALLDSLKGNGGPGKSHMIVEPFGGAAGSKPADQKSEVKGAGGGESNSGKSEKSVKAKSGATDSSTTAAAKPEGSGKTAALSPGKGAAVNASDKKGTAAGKGAADKDGQSHSQHFRTKSFDGFIPPPPPVQPSILMTGGMNGPGVMPFTVEYMNKDELLQKQKDLETQLSDAKGQLKDTEEAGAEKKTRAERFDPLYKEGVVSRHELEAAQKEAIEVDKEVERAKNRVTDLENQSASVERKLKEIAKRTLPVSGSPRKRVKK